jgi:outer membrane protein OmpA-like peptidoglycan-associated protein
MNNDNDDKVDDFLRQAALIGRASSTHQRRTKRRKVIVAVVAVTLLGGAGVYALARDSGADKAADGGVAVDNTLANTPAASAITAATSPTTDQATSVAPTEPTERTEPTVSSEPAVSNDPTTTVAPSTTVTADTEPVTVPPVTYEVIQGLPQAAFPGGQPWPNAVYQNDILYLRGTVPSQEIAQSVVTRLIPILGEEFIVNEFIVDAAVPLVDSVPVRLGNNSVLFKSGGINVPPESELGFTLWAAFLLLNPDVTLTIVGHTDNVGSREYNEQLALERANVAKAQIGKSSTEVLDRIEVVAKGPDEPIGDNNTSEGRQLNRRVEFAVFGFFTSQSIPS